MKCIDCKYCQISEFEFQGKSYKNACCELSNLVIKVDKEHKRIYCQYFN